MDLTEYKETKPIKLTEKDKVFLLTAILIVIIALILFFKFEIAEEKNEEAEVKVNPTSPETRKELSYKHKTSSEQNSLSFVEAKMISLQVKMMEKGQITCASQLSNVIVLYYSSDKIEALAGLVSVTDELLKLNINFSFPAASRKIRNHINFATKCKLITKSDKTYLKRMKEMTDENRLPFISNDTEQIESDLFKGLLIIENLI